jgi:hypothetical protein
MSEGNITFGDVTAPDCIHFTVAISAAEWPPKDVTKCQVDIFIVAYLTALVTAMNSQCWIWKEVYMILFKALALNLPGRTEKRNKKSSFRITALRSEI